MLIEPKGENVRNEGFSENTASAKITKWEGLKKGKTLKLDSLKLNFWFSASFCAGTDLLQFTQVSYLLWFVGNFYILSDFKSVCDTGMSSPDFESPPHGLDWEVHFCVFLEHSGWVLITICVHDGKRPLRRRLHDLSSPQRSKRRARHTSAIVLPHFLWRKQWHQK